MIISKILTGRLSIPHMCSKLIIDPYPGKTFFRLCTLLFTINCTFLNAQTLQQKLDKYLDEYHSQKNLASISAGVLKKNKIIWLGSYGYSDIDHHIKANSKTLYRIASISKVITAVAVMQLAEQKKIDLDADALKYIPYFPAKKWKFTVRQILQHTAGLRNYKSGEFNNTVSYSTTEEAVDVISKDPLEYKPGTKFLYTTLGYNLLAAVIENVSRMKFTDYLRKYIFQPSDMRSTFPEYGNKVTGNMALGYNKNNYRILQNAPQSDVSIKIAGGGLISTPEDLLKFSNCLLEGKLVKRSTLDSMLVPTKLPDGTILDSGLGFEIKKDANGKQFFGHYGHGTGFMTLLAIYPKDSSAAVDLINTEDRNIDSPAENLASIALGKPFFEPKKSLADKMMEITLYKGLDAAIKYLNIIKKDSVEQYSLTSDEYNSFGYDLLRIQHSSDAIRWFQLFENIFPSNISALIGTGDSYYNNGNRGYAMKYYRKALRLDSSNNYSIRMIKKLEEDE
jgi:CubicO group peptidase (beta-lactamase class C family)